MLSILESLLQIDNHYIVNNLWLKKMTSKCRTDWVWWNPTKFYFNLWLVLSIYERSKYTKWGWEIGRINIDFEFCLNTKWPCCNHKWMLLRWGNTKPQSRECSLNMCLININYRDSSNSNLGTLENHSIGDRIVYGGCFICNYITWTKL